MTAQPAPGAPRRSREDRFATIYEREHPGVLRFLVRRTTPGRAEDLAHETFLVAWRRLDDIPSREPDARAWLYTVARNCLLNDRRSMARHHELPVPVMADAAQTVAAVDEGVVSRVDFARAWATLSAAQQEVIALSVWDDLTSPQAGRVLGISSAAYRLRLHRARSALRLAFESALPEPSGSPAASIGLS